MIHKDNVEYLSLKCPECETAETMKIEMTPTFYIQSTIEMEITEMECENCGYEGEVEGKWLSLDDKE